MIKVIVTTTIYPPSKATIKFSQMKGWSLIVVGDQKTPHELYKDIDCIYLSPDDQQKKYPALSDAIGWNSIQRRNIGFAEALKMGAEIIATVDDDNIPYDNWGQNVYINQEISLDSFSSENGVFDPMSVTNYPDLWHRGYPLELLQSKNEVTYLGKVKRKVHIQADLWDGDPDIDAMCRLTKRPIVKLDTKAPFCGVQISPFNSQNTFFSREAIAKYMVLPHVGRMDDIWGGYILQKEFKDNLIYAPASVYQERNEQDLIRNLENEIIGYRNTLNLIKGEYTIPDSANDSYQLYLKTMRELI